MKINRIKILSPFRGLKPLYEVVFNNLPNQDRIEPLCFVGLNGSGKSNVLEVISECFYYLEAYSEERSKKELERYKTSFGFDMEFEMDPSFQDLNISWEKLKGFTWSGTGNIKIRFLKEQNELPKMMFPDAKDPIEINERENFILPNRIVAYSSGMNELISNPFVKIDFFYLEKIREQSKGLDTYRPQLNRMFLMDYEANKIITACTQIYKKDNNIDILNKEINIKDIHSFSIYFKTLRYNYQPLLLPSSVTLIIEKLLKCATTSEVIDAGKGKKYKLGFRIDENSRKAFFDNWDTAYDLFRDLYQLRLLNMFLIPDYQMKKARDIEHGKNLSAWLPKTSPVNQIFFMDDICFAGDSGEKIIYKHLSDGEHQLLHSLSGLMLLETRNSIFILDEPDTHFNPEWRSRFISLLNDVLKIKIKEQLVFVTSHSPFVVSDCKSENVFFFKKNEETRTAKEIDFNTYGASIDNILKNFFGSKHLISEYSYEKLKKVVEDGTIEELREAVEEFGESSEKQFLFRKLYEKTGGNVN
jgi:restriction system-associated AAA family ATPase